MKPRRYLTKSLFKLAMECQTKLFYTKKPTEYYDTSSDDPFLASLADGGYQVGALARYWFCNDPAKDTITTLDYDQSLVETAARLADDDITIAEAAFRYENLFVRADIIHKEGNVLNLYEVKSSSWSDQKSFWDKRKGKADLLQAKWKPYLYDVAFQKYVISMAMPEMTVRAFLVLTDKGKTATVDGLNQRFKVTRYDNGRRNVATPEGLSIKNLGGNILVAISVDTEIKHIWEMPFTGADGNSATFSELCKNYADLFLSGKRSFAGVGAKCRGCSFALPDDDAEKNRLIQQGLKSGCDECWRETAGERYRNVPTVLDIWKCRKKDAFIAAGKLYIDEVHEEELGDSAHAARQWLQVSKAAAGDTSPWIDRDRLRSEIHSWRYPLHFIDFETSRVAIPYTRGMRPYEQIAFQFSHHTVAADGSIRHAGQWLEPRPGVFPNFLFVRALKSQLDKDEGSIFRYATHENTVLNEIRHQLEKSGEPDREELMGFIDSITKPPSKSNTRDPGIRCMIDMCKLVIQHHYDPHTNGSNSLKAVLPAIINTSHFLRDKYSKPIYGNKIPSHNYFNCTWINPGSNDPYHLLPPLVDPSHDHELSDFLHQQSTIKDGGAALMAYSALQFFNLPDEAREQIVNGLLRYCELDTLAMVMLYEYWLTETL